MANFNLFSPQGEQPKVPGTLTPGRVKEPLIPTVEATSPAAAEPSLADLFTQGGVSVTPGGQGPGYLRPSPGGPSELESIFQGLGGVSQQIADAPEGTSPYAMSQAQQIREDYLGEKAPRMAQIFQERESEKQRGLQRAMPGISAEAEIQKAFGTLPADKERMITKAQVEGDLAMRTQRLVEHLPIVMGQFFGPNALPPEQQAAKMQQLMQAFGIKTLGQFMQAMPMFNYGLQTMGVKGPQAEQLMMLLLQGHMQYIPGFGDQLKQALGFGPVTAKQAAGTSMPFIDPRNPLSSLPGMTREGATAAGEALIGG